MTVVPVRKTVEPFGVDVEEEWEDRGAAGGSGLDWTPAGREKPDRPPGAEALIPIVPAHIRAVPMASTRTMDEDLLGLRASEVARSESNTLWSCRSNPTIKVASILPQTTTGG